MVTFPTGAVAVLKTTHNTYISIKPDQGARAVTQTHVGSYERIIVEPVPGESGIYALRSSTHGNYLCARPGSMADVTTQTYVGSYEKFTIESVSDEPGVYAIRTAHGTYIRAEPGKLAKVNTQTYVGSYEKFKINTIIDVGPSTEPSKIVALPKPHMIVSPEPVNYQESHWKDTFDVKVTGNDLHVSRSDQRSGWGQNLVLEGVENPKWTHTIYVGSSSSRSKKVKLPFTDMDVSPYPVNAQDPSWRDVFKVDVDGEWATITRLDYEFGWGQNLVLYARKIT